MTKTILASMETHLAKNVTTLSTCWKVVRKDGEVFGFTDHDSPLTIAGLVYLESSGYFRTAISNSSTAAVDNLDVEGFLEDDSISEDALRAGSFDYATVEVFMVNWADLNDGIIPLRSGLFGEVTIMSSGLFKVELRGLTQLLTVVVGDVYQPECRADFGDTDCGIQLESSQRKSYFEYSAGDRVVVPQTGTGLNKALFVPNYNFDIYPHDGHVTIGSGAAGIAWNESSTPGVSDGFYTYYMEGRQGTYSDNIEGHESDTVTLEFEVMRGPDWTSEQVTAQLLDRDGNATDSSAISPTASWVVKTLVATGDFQSGSGSKHWQLTVSASATPAVPAPTACILIRNLTVVSALRGDITPNPGFLPYAGANAVSSSSGTGNWQKDFFTMVSYFTRATPYIAPLSGNNMLSIYPLLHADSGITSDTIALSGTGVSDALIDSGDYRLEVITKAAASSIGGYFTIRIAWFDGASALISKTTSDNLEATTMNLWKTFSAIFTPVSGARSCTITFKPYEGAEYETMYFDTVVARLYEPTFLIGDYARYGGVEFEAGGTGRSATTAPAFNYTLAATTVDGSITWTAILPKFLPLGTITTVISNLIFESTDLVGYADNYFDWGIFEILDGDNVPRKMEVDTFTSATGRIELKLPLPYPLEVGQDFRVFAGCDKTREICFASFNNILNFRGEPDVPGTGQFFKVAGTR